MAFSRSWLKSKGYEAEQIDELIAEHTASTGALKAQIETIKAELDTANARVAELDKVKGELNKAKESLKTTKEQLTAVEKERDDEKSAAETARADIEKLKSDNAAKETAAKKEKALRAELKNGKYSDEAVSIIFDSKKDYASKVEFDDEGKATNLADIMGEINTAYPQYLPKENASGSNPATPPSNSGGTPAITKADIMKIKNTAERQKKIAENPELFGIK